jgi:hypothetical protein
MAEGSVRARQDPSASYCLRRASEGLTAEMLDQLTGPLNPLTCPRPKRFESPQCGLGILQRVFQTAGLEESEGDVELGSGSAEEISLCFFQVNRLSKVRQGAINVPCVPVDHPELMVRHGQVVHGIRWKEIHSLLVESNGFVEKVRGRIFPEALEGDGAELAQTPPPT